MVRWFLKGSRSVKWSLLTSFLPCASLIVAMVLGDSQPAYTLPVNKVMAIPAFARKYGLPCSGCHTAWPELNNFGQTFRDNGYQLGNDRDSPIYQNPSYFPITFRIAPRWHRESMNHQPIDAVTGDAESGLVQKSVTKHGFDLSGMDIWAAGTLYKNISFSLLPAVEANGTVGFENAFVRFDNLKSRWINVKFGKFELDNMISEKRFLFLSDNGGMYQLYHFVPPGGSNNFALGENHLGVELSGHSVNSYTRYGVAVLGGTNGEPELPANRGYDTYLTFSQAFQAGSLGLQRFGTFAYIGQRPTFSLTSEGVPIPGTGRGNKPFYRVGFSGDLNFGKLHFLPFFMHGHDNAFLGTSTPSHEPLPAGAQAPSWNGGFIETHYHHSPQLVFVQRFEIIRMAQQALPSTAGNVGNIDAYSVGYRWYPIMFSRAGLAFHNEYSIVKTQTGGASRVWSSSVLVGLDIDF
jgi:hypothetical protein